MLGRDHLQAFARSAVFLTCPLLLAASDAKLAPEPGPEPRFESAVQQIEAAVRSRLVDPDSATFEWPYGFTATPIKPFTSAKDPGWAVCGLLNSRNRLGGYSGAAYVGAAIKPSGDISFLIGENEPVNVVAIACSAAIKAGKLPLRPAAPPQRDQAAGPVGIQFLPSPAGAVIVAVRPGSSAAAAGFAVGQIIEAVNGASIKGLPSDAIIALIRAQPKPVFTVAGTGEVRLPR